MTMTQERMGEIITRATKEIEKDMLTIGELRRALARIQEWATDTPTPEDMERNLDLIVGECERVLSDT